MSETQQEAGTVRRVQTDTDLVQCSLEDAIECVNEDLPGPGIYIVRCARSGVLSALNVATPYGIAVAVSQTYDDWQWQLEKHATSRRATVWSPGA